MKSITLARRIALACAGALCLWSAQATAQTKIDVSIFHSEASPWTPTEKWWAQQVEKETEGRVKIALHFSGALVPLAETLKAVRNGAVPAGLVSAAAVGGQLRYMGYTEALTGMPTDPVKLAASLPALRPVLEKAMSDSGVEYLWAQTAGELISLCRTKFLKTPADWKSTKIRTAGRWQSEQVKTVGGSPQALDPSEIYLALQNGTVDCTLSVAILAPSLKLEQVAPKVTFLRQSNNLSVFIMNKETYAKISEKDRAAIRRVSMEADQRSVKDILAAQSAGEAFFSKTAGNSYKLSDAERDALRTSLAAALAPLQGEAGPFGQQVKAVLDAHR